MLGFATEFAITGMETYCSVWSQWRLKLAGTVLNNAEVINFAFKNVDKQLYNNYRVHKVTTERDTQHDLNTIIKSLLNSNTNTNNSSKHKDEGTENRSGDNNTIKNYDDTTIGSTDRSNTTNTSDITNGHDVNTKDLTTIDNKGTSTTTKKSGSVTDVSGGSDSLKKEGGEAHDITKQRNDFPDEWTADSGEDNVENDQTFEPKVKETVTNTGTQGNSGTDTTTPTGFPNTTTTTQTHGFSDTPQNELSDVTGNRYLTNYEYTSNTVEEDRKTVETVGHNNTRTDNLSQVTSREGSDKTDNDTKTKYGKKTHRYTDNELGNHTRENVFDVLEYGTTLAGERKDTTEYGKTNTQTNDLTDTTTNSGNDVTTNTGTDTNDSTQSSSGKSVSTDKANDSKYHTGNDNTQNLINETNNHLNKSEDSGESNSKTETNNDSDTKTTDTTKQIETTTAEDYEIAYEMITLSNAMLNKVWRLFDPLMFGLW